MSGGLYDVMAYLNFIPADLVGLQVQRETGAVPPVDGGGLGLVGVVDHTELAVLHIGVDIHIAVRGQSQVQLPL